MRNPLRFVAKRKKNAWFNLFNLYVIFITWVVELGVALCVRKEFKLGGQVSWPKLQMKQHGPKYKLLFYL